jgi:universal stress protein A
VSGALYSTIVVPMDFSPAARSALALARTLSETAGPSHIILVHSKHVPTDLEAVAADLGSDYLLELSTQAEESLGGLLTELQDAGISSEYLSAAKNPEQLIVDVAAEQGADLIVMGTHGRTGLAHLALGSVAERVVRTAPCPVLTVKPHTETQESNR